MPVSRFGVLTIVPADGRQRYVIVDQQTGCIVDGVYARMAEALEVAALCQSQGGSQYLKRILRPLSRPK